MLNNRVREAVETSVTKACPSVSFQISQLSSVPQSRVPAFSRVAVSGTASSSQRILLDHFGALGLERRRINAARVLAMLLVFSALGLRLWGLR